MVKNVVLDNHSLSTTKTFPFCCRRPTSHTTFLSHDMEKVIGAMIVKTLTHSIPVRQLNLCIKSRLNKFSPASPTGIFLVAISVPLFFEIISGVVQSRNSPKHEWMMQFNIVLKFARWKIFFFLFNPS